jgi:poly(A) polymerase
MKGNQDSTYAGRWVAKVRGAIVAHGGTPGQALLAAQKADPAASAEITYVPLDLKLPALLSAVQQAAPTAELYLVGGAVRDALLGRLSTDLDFVLPGPAISTARRIAGTLNADFYVLDEALDMARVLVQGEAAARTILDFSALRTIDRIVDRPGRAPGAAEVLEADLLGRDFTINAIAYDPGRQAILDPLDGAADLRAGLVRCCAATSIADDSIRILRGVRLAAELGFTIEPQTREQMKQAAALLDGISSERKRDEFFKILDGPAPAASVRALESLGTLGHFMHELSLMKGVQQPKPHVQDVWEHTLSVMRHLEVILAALGAQVEGAGDDDMFVQALASRLRRFAARFASHFEKRLNVERSHRALLLFAALYHDVGKPGTRSSETGGRIRFLGHEADGAVSAARRAADWNLSNAEMRAIETIVKNHMRFPAFVEQLESAGELPTRRAIYRYFQDAGEAAVDLVLLGLADLRGKLESTLTAQMWESALQVAGMLLENFWDKPQETIAPPRLVTGTDLMRECGLEEGPLVGQLLGAIREGQAVGEINSRAEALAFGRAWLEANRQ